MILPLFPEEQMRLKRIDKNTLFALKKLFINATFRTNTNNDVANLAAQKIAQDMIHDIFHDIETLPSDIPKKDGFENMV